MFVMNFNTFLENAKKHDAMVGIYTKADNTGKLPGIGGRIVKSSEVMVISIILDSEDL